MVLMWPESETGVAMIFHKSYIFTNRKHPKRGIMSVILGILSIGTFLTAVYLAYRQTDMPAARYGAAGLLAAIFMLAGFVLGILALMEKDRFRFFPILGILLNVIALMILSLILYAGAYVSL
jgi:hypothetical protein